MENNDKLKNEFHNQGGKLNVSYSPYINDLSYDFVETMKKIELNQQKALIQKLRRSWFLSIYE